MQANVFFFVTTITVAVIGIFAGIILFYVLKIVRDVREITEKMKRKSDEISMDIDDLRARIREDGVRFRDVAMFFAQKAGLFGGPSGKRRSTRKASGDENSSVS